MGRGAESEAKKAFSARWSPRTLDEARARAERVGVKFNQLTERYVQEGIRMDEHPLISFRDGATGRRPTLLGTRLDVATVIATVRQNDNSVEEAADYLRLPASHVEACVGYYLAYRDEIDAWIERDEQEAEAAELSWRRRQDAFA